jgi:hypothetical protein
LRICNSNIGNRTPLARLRAGVQQRLVCLTKEAGGESNKEGMRRSKSCGSGGMFVVKKSVKKLTVPE